VAGSYLDSTTTYYGYVWARNQFTTFSVPGSNPGPYLGTLDVSITVASTGEYSVIAGNRTTLHGFLRSPSGVITRFNVPGSEQALPTRINVAGTVAGYYVNPTDVAGYGFTRTVGGVFTTFDIPGCDNTYPGQINDRGVIAGQCVDTSNNSQGFVLATDGTSVVFAMPGATYTAAQSIGSDGSVVGFSFNQLPFSFQGFVRSPTGTLTVISVPGSASTNAAPINSSGTIAGTYSDAFGELHGFTAH
jgi:hypothetical protein